ncbi:MAG: hypothetical protein R3276_08200 [Marinobacter sp.]|nr:hypothetical protein [Marinobacter sp.]
MVIPARPLLYALLIAGATTANAWELLGESTLEARYFPQQSPFVDWQANGSLAMELEVMHDWNNRRDFVRFQPYLRLDQHDPERTHGDLAELAWVHVSRRWESRVGVSKVFWGVTEGRHLVDIINQTDLVDQIDEEQKLGQPMVNVSTIQPWGVVDLFVLPGFRERTFPGEDGRPRLPVPVDADAARYESGAQQWRTDFAARWQLSWGDWQLALSHFSGTSREPRFTLNLTPAVVASLQTSGTLPPDYQPRLIPIYEVIDQSGLELQYLHNSWLLKAEAISRSGQGQRFEAADIGFEYTQNAVFGSNIDIGWIGEYLWENRPSLTASPYDQDWLVGTRFTFNDVSSSQILAGLLLDPHTHEKVLNIEASRRLGSQLSLSFEARYYMDTGNTPSPTELIQAALMGKTLDKPLSRLSTEDLVQLSLTYYF